MIKFNMPIDTIGRLQSGEEIARGPFVAVHNGENGLGSYMVRNGDDITFWDGSRTITIDDSYDVTQNVDRVILRSTLYHSSFLFRAIELSDARWIYPDSESRPETREELFVLVADELSDRF